MRKVLFRFWVCLLLSLWMLDSSASLLERQRVRFLSAEQNLQGDFAAISKGLESYPLYPYLEYQWLKKNLGKTKQVKRYLKNNKTSRYARLLRGNWLNYLYKKEQWQGFVTYYKSSSSKRQQCRYQWARYQLNYKTKALIATKKIWLTGRSLPKDCNPLLAKFTQSKFLTQELVWQRFLLASKKRQIKLAQYLSKQLTSVQAKKNSEWWLRLVKQPELITQTKFLQGVSKAQQSDMLVYAIKRITGANAEKAAMVWEAQKPLYQLSATKVYQIERKIAMQMAFDKSTKAYARFKMIKQPSASTRIWTVRAALLEQNWQHVQAALKNLPAVEKRKQRWRYWQARTFMQTKQPELGLALYKLLAKERSYYGFLAADFLQQAYVFADKPIKLSSKKREDLLASKTFLMIREFRFLQRDDEAQRNWWDAINGLKGNDVLGAAKVAQEWQWHKLAILTVARVKSWDDVVLRFPIDYADEIKKNATLQELETPIIYGLVRRESMFDKLANSPAGALGLMQIMPRTGRQIAREMKLRWRSKSALLDAELNLKFGAYYYKQMLTKYAGNFALAAAAYNAGPHRVDRWIKTESGYPADIWVETIPYKETRGYVAAVLTYALVYQHRMGENKLTMQDFMLDIKPQSVTTDAVATGEI